MIKELYTSLAFILCFCVSGVFLARLWQSSLAPELCCDVCDWRECSHNKTSLKCSYALLLLLSTRIILFNWMQASVCSKQTTPLQTPQSSSRSIGVLLISFPPALSNSPGGNVHLYHYIRMSSFLFFLAPSFAPNFSLFPSCPSSVYWPECISSTV